MSKLLYYILIVENEMKPKEVKNILYLVSITGL